MIALLVHLILSQSAADTVARDNPSRARAHYQNACTRGYARANCDAFFAENPELLPYKADCARPPDPVVELKKLGEGGLHGLKETWDLIRNIGVAIWNGPQNTPERQMREAYMRECAKSQECKLSLLRSVRAEEISPEFENRIAQIDSGPILERLVDTNERRRSRLRQEEVRQLLLGMPEGPERDAKISEIIPEWSRRQDQSALSLWQLGLAGADRLLKFSACYSGEVQSEAVGYGIATLLIPGTALKVGSKLGQIAAILAKSAARTGALRVAWAERVTGQTIVGQARLEKAIADAHNVGAGQIGRDGLNPARFGNYTDAQLREKLRVLQEGGFSPQAAKDLIRKGVAGHDEVTMKLIARAESEFDRLERVVGYYAGDPARSTAILRLQAQLLEQCIDKGLNCKELLEQTQKMSIQYTGTVREARPTPAATNPGPALVMHNPEIETHFSRFSTTTQAEIRKKIASLEQKAVEAASSRLPGQNIDFTMGKPLMYRQGMRELRLFEPGGPRIYFAFDARTGRLDILGIGNKADQAEDIARAERYFKKLQTERRG